MIALSRIAVFFTAILACILDERSCVSAFAPSKSLTFYKSNGNSVVTKKTKPVIIAPTKQNGKTAINMIPGHEHISIHDLDSLQTGLQSAHDFLVHNMNIDSSMLLSDASDAVADAAEEGGWWQDYLNIFKAGLILVHSVVDEPLRGLGITQTWGPSIFLFTFGTSFAYIDIDIDIDR